MEAGILLSNILYPFTVIIKSHLRGPSRKLGCRVYIKSNGGNFRGRTCQGHDGDTECL
jgi:hypothetical protein